MRVNKCQERERANLFGVIAYNGNSPSDFSRQADDDHDGLAAHCKHRRSSCSIMTFDACSSEVYQ